MDDYLMNLIRPTMSPAYAPVDLGAALGVGAPVASATPLPATPTVQQTRSDWEQAMRANAPSMGGMTVGRGNAAGSGSSGFASNALGAIGAGVGSAALGPVGGVVVGGIGKFLGSLF